jgi:hypothetical protein
MTTQTADPAETGAPTRRSTARRVARGIGLALVALLVLLVAAFFLGGG